MTTRRAACSCGQLSITTEGEPARIAMCHCLECQRRTGAVISNQARFSRGQVTIAGKSSSWNRKAESGNALTFYFCPVCGSPVYLSFAETPELIAVHAGSLDEPGRFRPQVLTYSVRGLAWDAIDSSLKAFERMPTGGRAA